jgi:endonuclease/exonuclease/phosphatase (EEP) superfamily protein YafD
LNLFLYLYASLIFCFSLLPLIRNDYWIFRIFDYPRLQKLVLVVLCLFFWIMYFSGPVIPYWGVVAILSIIIIHLVSLILPFTPLSEKQVLDASADLPDQAISIMITNVFEDNLNTKGCLAEIYKAKPDVVILLETNKRWERETLALEDDYPHYVRVPIENTYGLLLYSKLELADTQVKYLVQDDIPSIHTKLRLRNGQQVQLYAVHPTPPVPKENVRSTERDKELLLVADLAKASNLPVIVAGDLNDVAWSHTTELFLKMSGLLDPRRGRGFFNSFHAHYPFLRFPLDHAFSSEHFKLRQIQRLSNFGSDHFPIFLKLQYEAQAAAQQEPMHPDADEVEEAQEKKTKI